ncbi:MAG: hypothetical protein M1819_002291 [Sarea resinae]|nr:MAG: hypothetical protein M1819_002291 [Sarea resinae]
MTRSFEQIVFFLPQQATLAQKYAADFTIQLDSTHSTSKQKLTLDAMIGISNIRGDTNNAPESVPLMYFVHEIRVADARRTLIDAASRSPWPADPLPRSALGGAIQQYCQWHAVEAIKKLIKHKLGGERAAEAANLAWQWSTSATADDVAANRAALLEALPEEVDYLRKCYLVHGQALVLYYVQQPTRRV